MNQVAADWQALPVVLLELADTARDMVLMAMVDGLYIYIYICVTVSDSEPVPHVVLIVYL